MKKFLTIFLLMLLFAGGCKRQNSSPELTFATWGSKSEIAVIKPLLSEFEQKNGVKIELIHIPQNYFQKIHLLFASNQAPDVFFLNNFYLPIYVRANLLEDLSGEVNKNEYFKSGIDALSQNNKLYAVPRDISNLVVYYNKDIFDKNKIPYPNQNWNFNDFLITAQKLTNKQTETFGIGFEENPLFWLPFLWSQGGGIYNPNGDFILNSPESISSLKYYIDLKNTYKVAPSNTQSANMTMAQMFLNGKIAMQISGRWLVPKYREEADFNWDVINFPNGKNGSIVDADTSGWAVSKSSNNKTLAISLVKFLSSKSSIGKMAQSGLIVPARKDVAYSNTFLQTGQKPLHAKVFLDINKSAIPTPVVKDYNKKIEKLQQILEPYFLGKEKITPQTTFEL